MTKANAIITDHSFRLKGSNGRGVMLIHGLSGAPGEMKFLAKRLNRQGFDVLVPQLAGHGGDIGALLKTTWKDWARSLLKAYDGYVAEVSDISVGGICVGGALSLLVAEARPVRAVAVYSMTFEYDGWNMPNWGAAAPLIQLFANLPVIRTLKIEEPYPFGLKDERLRTRAVAAPEGFIEGALDHLPLGSLYQMYRLGRHVEKIGTKIKTPTLIVHAREDDMSDPRNAFRLERALGGPVTVQMLDDSYHMVHVDRERDLVAKLTGEFFNAPSLNPVLSRDLVHG